MGFMRIRKGDGSLVELPEGQLFIELVTSDGRVAMVVFESQDRIFLEQPGEPTFASYCKLYKLTPGDRPAARIPG